MTTEDREVILAMIKRWVGGSSRDHSRAVALATTLEDHRAEELGQPMTASIEIVLVLAKHPMKPA